MAEEMDNIIELTDENGVVEEFIHLDTAEIEGIYYVALTPYVPDADEDDEEEIIIMKIVDDGEGNEILSCVEDDDELNCAFEIFQQRYEESFNGEE